MANIIHTSKAEYSPSKTTNKTRLYAFTTLIQHTELAKRFDHFFQNIFDQSSTLAHTHRKGNKYIKERSLHNEGMSIKY